MTIQIKYCEGVHTYWSSQTNTWYKINNLLEGSGTLKRKNIHFGFSCLLCRLPPNKVFNWSHVWPSNLSQRPLLSKWFSLSPVTVYEVSKVNSTHFPLSGELLPGTPLHKNQVASSLKTNLLQKSFNKFFSRHGLIVEKYGAALREMRLAIQA